MNKNEKIIGLIIAIVILVISITSYVELTESQYTESSEGEISDFDESFGPEFKMGAFDSVASSSSSNEIEENCEPQKPVIVAVLHEINEQLENGFLKYSDTFEVNPSTLQLFCKKTAEITLVDTNGTKLLLQKTPFTRAIPEGGTSDDEGTLVKISATTIDSKKGVPSQNTIYSQMVIPDKFLEIKS